MVSEPNRGVKRKYEPPEEEIGTKIAKKLHHEVKEVHKASKKAKTFETQKVIKRLKDVRKQQKSPEDIQLHEEELTCLKEIDCDGVGNSALRSKIHKDKFLRDKEEVKEALAKEIGTTVLTPAAPGSTLAKIQARMTSSKLLAAQIATSVEALKVILDPSRRAQLLVEDPQSPERSTKKAKASEEAPQTHADKKDPGKAKKKAKRTQEDGSDDEASLAGVEDDGGWESGSIGGEEADADGWESGSIDNEGPDRGSDDDSSESHVGDPREDDESPSSNESDGEDSEDDVHRKSGKATTSKSSSKAESTFLPSLSVGYMLGDSDASDVEREAKVSDPKKNRRGQRARRAIWEKKYGRGANHKKKEAQEQAAALEAAKARKAARQAKTGSNTVFANKNAGARGSVTLDSGWAGRSQARVQATEPKRTEEKPVHPSWEAKRKLKEKESVGIIPSQGKKIKFS